LSIVSRPVSQSRALSSVSTVVQIHRAARASSSGKQLGQAARASSSGEQKGWPSSERAARDVQKGKAARGRLHIAFWMASFMYDKPFVAKACDIGVQQKAPHNLHIWPIRHPFLHAFPLCIFICLYTCVQATAQHENVIKRRTQSCR
jgi:hypothetical protein